MRVAIVALLVLSIGAGLGLVYIAGREERADPAGAAESQTPVGEPTSDSTAAETPSARPEPTAAGPAPDGAPAGPEGRIEVAPDGSVTITNIPRDPNAPRVETRPDGGVWITNRPRGRAAEAP